MIWLLWLYIINGLLMLIIAIREARRPANALIWIMVDLVLPLIGFALYLSTTNPARLLQERLTSSDNESDTLPISFSRSASVIANALRNLSVHGLRTGRVQVLTNGLETYEQLIKSIQKANRTIDLEYYIYRDDHIGRRITDQLIERAAAGVQIRFIRDGFGSRQFPQRALNRMMEAGIDCRIIFPLRFPWILSNWNYRDHSKIVLIDGTVAFTGGINVGDEYTGLKKNVGFWRDTHLQIEGEAAKDLEAIFNAHWNIASSERKPIPASTDMYKRAPLVQTALSGWSAESSEELGRNAGNEQDTYVQTLEGNPGLPTPVMRQAYFICVTQATKTLDITTPYFAPEEDIIMALKTAALRGVRARLLVPRHVDQVIVGLASQTYYGELLEAGVQIYQYDKGMLHAKLMIIDGEVAEVGAANYDMRSFRWQYEVCQVLYSTGVARQLTEQFERDLTESIPLRMEDLLQRSLPQRIIQQAARLLSPLI
ncbi:MAG: cardiolipin synthase [Bacilli bacterium]|nr:cardiolipin synthase [Bacilli bacterium]